VKDVIAELERYLACGILANGCTRARSSSCDDEIAFSCDLLFAARPMVEHLCMPAAAALAQTPLAELA